MLISFVGWSKCKNSLSIMALVIYCLILSIIPLSNLHMEGSFLPAEYLLTERTSHETDLMILIHEVLFAYLCHTMEHLYSQTDRVPENLIGPTSENLPFDIMALMPYRMLLALFTFASYVARRFSLRHVNAVLQPVFCYRLIYHSPPFPHSL